MASVTVLEDLKRAAWARTSPVSSATILGTEARAAEIEPRVTGFTVY